MTSSNGWPLMPPASLICSASISAVFFSGSPRKEAPPVTEKTAPILKASAGLISNPKLNMQAVVIIAIFLNDICFPPFTIDVKNKNTLGTQQLIESRPMLTHPELQATEKRKFRSNGSHLKLWPETGD